MNDHGSDADAVPRRPSRRGRHARLRRVPPVHPLLFAAFPVLFLWAHNLEEGITFGDVVRPLALVIGGAAVVWLLGIVVLRSVDKASLVVSILVLLFFSYGYLYRAAQGWHLGAVKIGSNVVLAPVWVMLALGGIALAVRGGNWLSSTTAGLNVMATGLILLNIVPIVQFQVEPNASGSQFLRPGDVRLPSRLLEKPPPHRPDIYFIVLDEYGGAKALRDQFGYDNSPFLDFLSRKGFYVAANSVTNYPRTELSVATSLNMKYMNYLPKVLGSTARNLTPLARLLQDNQVGRILKSLGYRYIQIGSWWTPTAISPLADVNIRFGGASEFAQLLYQTTALAPVVGDDIRHQRWKGVQFQFAALGQLDRFKGPRFVFAHILCPHSPIVFDRFGHYLSYSEQLEHSRASDYVGQLIYVNTRVEQAVNTLLDRPADQRPVIIIQSDEGPYSGAPTDWTHPTAVDMERKFDILNAIYTPGVVHTGLYPTITPVNTFRLILDDYFDADLPILPDRSYIFENLRHLYAFTDVTQTVRQLVSSEQSPSPSHT
jgi:hypothetical protein